jgi:hypothetical protein
MASVRNLEIEDGLTMLTRSRDRATVGAGWGELTGLSTFGKGRGGSQADRGVMDGRGGWGWGFGTS